MPVTDDRAALMATADPSRVRPTSSVVALPLWCANFETFRHNSSSKAAVTLDPTLQRYTIKSRQINYADENEGKKNEKKKRIYLPCLVDNLESTCFPLKVTYCMNPGLSSLPPSPTLTMRSWQERGFFRKTAQARAIPIAQQHPLLGR